MTRVQRAFRTVFTLWLVAWPLVHMTSSKLGAFSSWRFAGWGMYATPYPSSLQSPIHIVLSEPGAAAGARRSLDVHVDGAPVDVAREGLRFTLACSSCTIEVLDFSLDGARRIAALARAARHLDAERSLAELARVVRAELRRDGVEHLELHVRKSDRFAEPIPNRYGYHHRDYSFGPRATGPSSGSSAMLGHVEPSTSVARARRVEPVPVH